MPRETQSIAWEAGRGLGSGALLYLGLFQSDPMEGLDTF